ncbi:MAG TPA: COQ9 family protein, partial [Aliiroseovarius sp.]|nr:COQ9 family protein [Aliiroseovarius sp.]
MVSKDTFLDAVLPHVVFDGWSREAMQMAAAELGVTDATLAALFPRGPVDMALAYHQRGDDDMARRWRATDKAGMRYRDQIALGVRLRLEVADRELVRRGMALLALPQYAALGSAALWGTAGR